MILNWLKEMFKFFNLWFDKFDDVWCRILNSNESSFSPRRAEKSPWTKWQTPWILTLIFIQKQVRVAEIQTVVFNSYDNYLKFKQCNCSSSRSCKLENETRQEIDIGKNVDFWTDHEIVLPFIILGFFLVIILYVVVESFVGKQISMQRFILGTGNERNSQTINNEGTLYILNQ